MRLKGLIESKGGTETDDDNELKLKNGFDFLSLDFEVHLSLDYSEFPRSSQFFDFSAFLMEVMSWLVIFGLLTSGYTEGLEAAEVRKEDGESAECISCRNIFDVPSHEESKP